MMIKMRDSTYMYLMIVTCVSEFNLLVFHDIYI